MKRWRLQGRADGLCRAALLLAALAVVLGAAVPAPARAEAAKVTLQLKWTHQFQFAGIYAAIAQGYYRDAGLDVALLKGGPETDPVAAVARGDAEFGIGNSSLLIDHARGRPIKVVAPIFQHSPFVILARRDQEMENVHDLVGRRLGLEEHAAECMAYLKRSGVPVDRIDIRPHPGDPLALRAGGGLDAISAYTTTEPYDLINSEVPYQVWSPRDLGIDFYGDTLFVDAAFAEAQPELVRAFRRATIRGWHYALAHPTRIIDLILRDYAPSMNHLKLGFEAEEIKRLMLTDIVDIGYSSRARWRHIADVFAEAGMIPVDYPLDGFVFEDDMSPDLRWLYLSLAAAVALVLVVSLVAHRFYRFSRALRQELEARRALEAELSALARTDELTRLPNRRSFFETAEELLAGARRKRQGFAIVAFDIDRFKAINDTWGHAVGDQALGAVADACRATVPADGMLARIGGEEFAAALPGLAGREAMLVAERLRAAVAGVAVRPGSGQEVQLTASFGVAAAAGRESLDGLISTADAAMYASKRAGGNRVSDLAQATALAGG